MLQQASHEKSHTAGTVAAGVSGSRGNRIVAAGPHTSAEFVARGIVAGTCLEIQTPALYPKSGGTTAANTDDARVCPSSSGGADVGCGVGDGEKERAAHITSAVEVEGVTRSSVRSGRGSPGTNGGFASLTTNATMTYDTSRTRDEGTLEHTAAPDCGNDAAGADLDSVAKTALSSSVVATAPMVVDKDGRRARTTGATSVNGGNSTALDSSCDSRRQRSKLWLLPIKPPTHGFHLVDLHAVVRNSVEWSTWLPKVCEKGTRVAFTIATTRPTMISQDDRCPL